jgi:hypothetical protein
VFGAVLAALLFLQSATSPQSTTPFFHSIARIHRDPPAENLFGIQGWVTSLSGGEEPSVLVSADRPSGRQATARQVRLRAQGLAGLETGEHYRFLIRAASGEAFELIEFQRVPAGEPQFIRVGEEAVIERVQAAVQDRLGKDFSLDHLPADPTLEAGVAHLTSESAADIVRGALIGVPAIYGVEVEAGEDGESVRVFVFSTRPDFRGEVVYAVSRRGDWPVFVTRPK